MATWTTIPDASLEPDKPARGIDALALRDNPVAIAEGATGATRIVIGAMANTVAGTIAVYNSGDTFSTSAIYPAYEKAFEWVAGSSGVVRVYRTHAVATMYTRIYVNGVAVAAEQTGAGLKSDDITYVSGDLVQIYANQSSDGGPDIVQDPYLGISTTGGLPIFSNPIKS